MPIKIRFTNHWVRWGILGLVFGGVASAVCLMSDSEVIEDLQTYIKIILGLGGSIATGAIASGLSTAKYYCHRTIIRKKLTNDIEEKLNINVNNETLAISTSSSLIPSRSSSQQMTTYHSVAEILENQVPAKTNFSVENLWLLHIARCNHIVSEFLSISDLILDVKQSYLTVATKLRDYYSDLSDVEYLAQLKSGGC